MVIYSTGSGWCPAGHHGYLLGIYHISQLEVLAPKDGNLAAAPKDKAAFILSAQFLFFSNRPRIGVNQFPLPQEALRSCDLGGLRSAPKNLGKMVAKSDDQMLVVDSSHRPVHQQAAMMSRSSWRPLTKYSPTLGPSLRYQNINKLCFTQKLGPVQGQTIEPAGWIQAESNRLFIPSR